MKLLPTYIEDKGLKPSNAISIIENSNVLSKKDAISISGYMRSCLVLVEWLSSSPDPLNKKKYITTRSWSDGVYIWRELHIHFIEKYRVRLPRDFYLHVKAQMENGFDLSNFDKDDLYDRYQEILKLIVQGDESFYDISYYPPSYPMSKESRVIIDGSFYSEPVKKKR